MKENIYTKGQYLKRHPTWHEEDSPWKAKQIIKMLERNQYRPKTICEVGCGAGEILNQLYAELDDDITFTGYEISPQAYSLCKKKEKDRLIFYLRDILQENKFFFDLILIIDVIEHIKDYFGFLETIREKAKVKIFHIPIEITVQRVLLSAPILRRRNELGHIHYFTKETALASLEDAGYEIVDYFYTPISIDLPAQSFMYALGKMPLKIMSRLNKDLAVRILGGHSLMVMTK